MAGIRKWTDCLRVVLQSSTNLCRDVLSTTKHNLVRKMISIAYRHSQEGVPVLDRDGPLPGLQDLTKLSIWPGYPVHNIAEMATGPLSVSECSSGRVGVI